MILICKDCSVEFNVLDDKKGITPVRCKQCREKKKQRNRDKEEHEKQPNNPKDYANIVVLNQKISLHAKRKELLRAKLLYEKAKRLQWINSHTFAATLNAYVRCGDFQGAHQVFTELCENPDITLDIVSCTTMLKGFAIRGDMKGCIGIVEMMENSNVIPNIRTCNTFLRCCVIVGDVHQAEKMIVKMPKEFKIEPDISSWEYLISILCQSLQIHKALPIAGRLKENYKDELIVIASGLAAIHLSIAKAAMILNNVKICRKSIAQAEDALQLDQMIDLDDISKGNNDELSGGVTKRLTGGKRSWKDYNAAREDSLQVFRSHKRSEIRSQLAELTKKSSSSALVSSDRVDYFRKVFLISEIDVETEIVSSSVGEDVNFGIGVFNRNNYCLGLMEFVKKFKNNKKLGSSNEILVEEWEQEQKQQQILSNTKECGDLLKEEELKEYYKNSFDEFGYINFHQVFQDISSAVSKPCNLEVCSGNGDWIISQALANTDSNWISLELRNDRVYSTFTKAILNECKNICVIGGDANRILQRHITSASIAAVFINHPEPPQQIGNHDYDSQASHLLQDEFFTKVERVLQCKGTLTILTDNLWYGKLLVRLIPTISREFISSMKNVNISSGKIREENCGYVLYEGYPGVECGYDACTTSYFDKLKSKELEKKGSNGRYYIHLVKSLHEVTR